MTVEYGPLHASDAERCAELERALFPGDDPWPPRAFTRALRDGHTYVAARDGDTLVGYAGLAVLGRPPHVDAEVHTIGVDPAWQGRGVGRTLLRLLLDIADRHAAQTFLEVRTDNVAAIALYRATGFEIVNTRRRYYRPSGADAYTMRRPAVRVTSGDATTGDATTARNGTPT